MKTILFVSALMLISATSINAQETIIPPSEGKAVIYFLRTTSLGALMNFRFFDEGNFIGKFNDRNYLRYQCDPGERVFWVKAENIDVLKTNLEVDKIYLVEANAVMGAMSAGVKFKLVNFDNEKQMKRINKLLETKKAVEFTQEELETEQEKSKLVIQHGMKTVSKKLKKGKRLKIITPDMAYKQ
ncbi:DUF2846 domain-containing protein [Winogradskyella alexanderae]|uniref:DUF2846 domain-containing protein n=1 Tax=Winogradskyella alexanderae TaxID=2877123 RepID=A0ABS7XUN6_9FLAO|nr:DUF2846 domain-containing protein [Winogradskyella alexanderae]MCA0133723.1 DUF2846 domain-containing protein [Winogradskyella alexanderae]